MTNTCKPLSPLEIMDNLDNIIPSFVIESINNLLRRNFRGNSSVILKQEEIIHEILRQKSVICSGIDRKYIFDNKWLNFEFLFEKYGWEVFYDKPGYNETYEPTFEFTPKNAYKSPL